MAHSIDYKPGGGYSAPAPRRNLNEQYQTQSDGGYLSPDSLSRHDFKEEIAILRDDRNLGDGGSFTADIETENGIYESRSGSRLDDVEYNPIGQQGQISYIFLNFYRIKGWYSKFLFPIFIIDPPLQLTASL